jgi:hypothetical protein
VAVACGDGLVPAFEQGGGERERHSVAVRRFGGQRGVFGRVLQKPQVARSRSVSVVAVLLGGRPGGSVPVTRREPVSS